MPIFPLLLVAACAGAPESPLPMELAPCPSSPNCVSTQADAADAEHWMAPIHVQGDPDAFMARVDEVVLGMKRVRLQARETDYRHFVFTTAVMRFKDDVQLELDRDAGLLHFRSASRVGQSDLGVNRRRMERIRVALSAP